MTNKELLNLWTKLCLRKNTSPICLITVSKDGHPHVFSNQDKKILKQVYKHLLEEEEKGEVTHFDNQEN